MNVGCINDSPCPQAAQDLAEETLHRKPGFGSGVKPSDSNTNSAMHEPGDLGLFVPQFVYLRGSDNNNT